MIVGRDRSIGTARAINDSTMSAMIENKLGGREGEKKNDDGYNGQSNINSMILILYLPFYYFTFRFKQQET